MWGVGNVVNRLRIVPAISPPPPPEPSLEPAPSDANAKKAEQNQLGVEWRDRLERFVAPVLASIVEAGEPVSDPNDPSPQQILQIAQENAPLLVLPEGNLPADPNAFIANSRLRENVPIGVDVDWGFPPVSVSGADNQIGDNTNDDAGDNFSSADVGAVTNENYFLDLDNDMRGELGSEDAPVFYEFQPAQYDVNGNLLEPPKLTYHIFYAYNDAPAGGPTPGTEVIDLNHEGDWERVTYELDPVTFQPVNAVLSAHNGGSTIEFQNLDTDPVTGRPLIYVADGSHANYEQPGTKPLQFNAEDQTAVDQNGDGMINETDGVVIFDTAGNLNEVTSQDWYPEDGSGLRWGEIGALSTVSNVTEEVINQNIDHSSGPQGPSENKGAVEP